MESTCTCAEILAFTIILYLFKHTRLVEVLPGHPIALRYSVTMKNIAEETSTYTKSYY